jgi:photosystem II stability/assembly factor-like uncharacterized protein
VLGDRAEIRQAAPAAAAALTRLGAQVAIVDIQSPDPQRRWRIRGGIVERSDNAGGSWQPVGLPPGAVPVAGAAPLPNVCWLVGRSGLVLRTTDGVTFRSVSVPGAGDLVTVRAEDANRATVMSSDGRGYATVDGGMSWR